MQFVNDFIQNTKNALKDLTNPQIKSIILLVLVLQFLTMLFTSQNAGVIAILLMPVVFVLAIAENYFMYKSVHALLPSPKKQYSFITFLKLILLCILQGLVALFSVFDLKWLAVLVLTGILFICGIVVRTNPLVSLALFAVGCLLLFVYLLIVIRNVMRLCFIVFDYLQDPSLAFFSSFKTTWSKTSGKALKILTRFAIFGLVVMLPLGCVYMGLFLIGAFLDNILNLPLNLFTAVLAAPAITLLSLLAMFYYLETYKSMFQKTQIDSAVQTISQPVLESKAPAKAKIVSKKKK